MQTEQVGIIKPDLPRIVAFSRDKPVCWSVMPDMLERIGKFAEQHCPDTIPEFLVEAVMQDFTNPHSGFLLLGAMDDDYKLVGHLLACVSTPAWSQKRRCLILQYGIDEGARIPIDFIRAAFEMIIDWAKTQYCGSIIAETKTEVARRIFTTFYDFEIDLVQVTRSL